MALMRAIVVERFGSPDGLRLRQVERPSPQPNELLIRVHAASVTAGDVVSRSLPFLLWLPMRLLIGLRRKRIPGYEFAGVVESTGSQVTSYSAGDRMFGTTSGLSVGGCAEYVCVPARWQGGVLAKIPDNVGFAHAAAVPVGGMTALHFLRKGGIEHAKNALIYGASGSVGTYAVQLARHFGATVTGVCSGPNAGLIQSLGAARVLDYTKESFADAPDRYDVVFDAVGKARPEDCKSVLVKDGRFVSVAKGLATEKQDDLLYLCQLLRSGALRPVIDRRFPLQHTAEAHRFVESGHKRGNVVITVIPESPGDSKPGQLAADG